ncbi:DUF6884 domain-containing protein [Streptomyces sp. NPDC053726]|uniref:DUF6884 domain-containing protein n=1 Tax=Streptomyces sp. NPDC053726 TaxID=3365713 RepID=UPI0037D04604
MKRIEGLPANVSIESLTLRDDAYAVLCLTCGGGGAPAAVETCRGPEAKGTAWTAAVQHDAEHARRREELESGELRRQQAAALGWSQAQADAMLWADMGHLHWDGARYFRKDMEDPRAGRGRAVAKSRVEALISAGFLQIWESDWSVIPTHDGHAARRAWRTAGEPADTESRTLRPLMGGEEEARQDAERAAYLAAARAEQAERAALARRFAPEPAPAAVDPAACDHERYTWLYLTADRITGRLGYHLACACEQETKAYAGSTPAMSTGTATRPLGIADAGTEVAAFHADRCGYGVTGRWDVLDEHTKRATVEPADEPLWPAVTDPNRAAEAAPVAAVDQDAAEQPAPADSVTAAQVTETDENDEDQDDEPADGPCNHVETQWLYVAAEEETRQLRAYLTCGCDRGPKLGNFNMRTAVLPTGRSVAAAQTRTAQALAERNNYEVTGGWEVLDDDTKRAPVRWTLAAAPAAEPAAESVTVESVTKTAGPVAVDDDPAEAYAAWIDRQAERSDRLAVDGPGIVGPGTHITYRDGCGPGMRSKHSTSGTVVRIGRTAVAWRPYGARRVLRTPLDDMRVNVPRTGAAVEGSGRTAGWRRWSLAEHLAYAHPSTTPAPEAVSAAESAPQTPAGPDTCTAAAEAVQLPLWPALVATRPLAADVEPAAPDSPAAAAELRFVAAAPVTKSPAAAAGEGPVVVIPCSGAKLDRPAPAGELYRGSLHTMCRRAADALTAGGGTVVVLSARWGLVPLARVIAPYELRMGDPGSITADELRAQAARLGIDRAEDVTVLASATYTTAARSVWSHAAAPLAGSRGIGEMRRRLAQLARTGRRQTA